MANTVRTPSQEDLLKQALAEREIEIDLLLETSKALSIDFDIPGLLQTIADRARKLLNCKSVLIPILDKECTEYTYMAVSGEHSSEILGESLPLEFGVCGWVWRHKRAWWHGVLDELDPKERNVWENNARNILLVPLFGKKHFLGGIACMNKEYGVEFTKRDLDLLTLFANQAAIAVENAILYDELNELNNNLEKRVERRTLELKQINKEMEMFSYSVSHDLRAPLRSVLGFSEAILEDYAAELKPEIQDYLGRIHHSAEQMQQLIEALLKLARLRRNPINKEYIDLTKLAAEVIEESKAQQPEARFSLALQENVTALGDMHMLRIVLKNLFGNAIKFSQHSAAPQIEFGTYQKNDEQVYYIRDNGVGFDMANADRLFGAFQRLHSQDEFEGTGIGLATVAQIIHRHEGSIWAESQPNQGATFYFTLGY